MSSPNIGAPYYSTNVYAIVRGKYPAFFDYFGQQEHAHVMLFDTIDSTEHQCYIDVNHRISSDGWLLQHV